MGPAVEVGGRGMDNPNDSDPILVPVLQVA